MTSRHFLERAFPYLLLLPFILPIIWVGGVLYPFITPKVLLLRADALLGLGVFCYLMFTKHSFYWTRLRKRFIWIPAALLVVAYGTSAFGVDFSLSFWSTYVRGDGLATLTALTFFFYALVLYADRVFMVRVLKIIAVVGSIAAVIGFFQWLAALGGGVLPLLPPGTDRIGGTLGNAAYFAAYLSMTAFATFAVQTELSSRTWRTVALCFAWLQILVAVLTATRGSIVAIGAALLVWLIWNVVKAPHLRSRRAAAGILVVLVLFGGVFVLARHSFTNSSIEPVARLASISTSDPDVSSRLFVWQHVLVQTVSSGHWILGYGAEHITTPFDQVYNPTQLVEEWFDRTHDAYLDYLVQFGIFGVLLYLGLLIAVFISLLRAFKRGEKLFGFLELMVLVYAVQNIFIFDTSSTLLLLLFAFAVPSIESSEKTIVSFELPEGAALMIPLLAIILLWWVVWLPLRANMLLVDAYSYQITDPSRADSDLTQGFALGTYGNLEYGYEAYTMYTGLQVANLSGQALDAAYATTFSILSDNFNHYPYDARTALYLAHVLSLAPANSPPDLTMERQVLARAIALSPGREQPWYILTNLTLSGASTEPANSPARLSAYQTAIGTLGAYTLIEPDVAEPHFILAQLYQAIGATASSSAQAALGKQTYTPDLETALRAAGYYEGVQDWPNAAYFLQSALTLSPTDYSSEYDLAKVLYLEGQEAQSDQLVNKLRASDPSIVTTDANFYAAITAYEHGQ